MTCAFLGSDSSMVMIAPAERPFSCLFGTVSIVSMTKNKKAANLNLQKTGHLTQDDSVSLIRQKAKSQL